MHKSIISNENYCFFCGRNATANHHLIFGTDKRRLADEDGIFVPICDKCHTQGQVIGRIHDNPMAEKLSKKYGQSEWEKHYIVTHGMNEVEARAKFIERYGINYL